MRREFAADAMNLKANRLIRALETGPLARPEVALGECVTCTIDDEPKLRYARYFQSFLIALNDNTDFEFRIGGATAGCTKFYYHAINFDRKKKPLVVDQIRNICGAIDIKEMFHFDRVSAFNILMYNSSGGRIEGKK